MLFSVFRIASCSGFITAIVTFANCARFVGQLCQFFSQLQIQSINQSINRRLPLITYALIDKAHGNVPAPPTKMCIKLLDLCSLSTASIHVSSHLRAGHSVTAAAERSLARCQTADSQMGQENRPCISGAGGLARIAAKLLRFVFLF